MRKSFEVLRYLADGERHSGSAIAEALGITRAAVWEHVTNLRAAGLEIPAISGRGYRLAGPFDLLDADLIRATMSPAAQSSLRSLVIHRQTDSTNQRLLGLTETTDIHEHVHLAELQSRGRGRRGDSWIAPLGGGLCFSLGWRFENQPASFTALGLVVGLCVVDVLARYCQGPVGLKWPNDIFTGGRKLGGILIELRSELAGPMAAVIGIGINFNLPDDFIEAIDQPCTDLRSVSSSLPSRNAVAGALIESLLLNLGRFTVDGFKPWMGRWAQHDVLAGHSVRLKLPDGVIDGIAAGVDDNGALLLHREGRLQRFVNGSVSII